MAACNVCNRRVQSHAYKLQCSLCNSYVHLNCLTNVPKDDPLYTRRADNTWFCTLCSQSIFAFNHFFDNDDFIEAISDLWFADPTLPFDYINDQNLLFSPFELNSNESSPLIETDPDVQFYSNQCNSLTHSCDYYLEDGFNKRLSKLNASNS